MHGAENWKIERELQGSTIGSIYTTPPSDRFFQRPSVAFGHTSTGQAKKRVNVLLLRVKAKNIGMGCDARHTLCGARNT